MLDFLLTWRAIFLLPVMKNINGAIKKMKTVTLNIEDSINDKFMWLLNQFAFSGIKIVDQSEYSSDEKHLISLDHTIESISNNRYNFQDLVGRLQWTGDAVCEQKRLRDDQVVELHIMFTN